MIRVLILVSVLIISFVVGCHRPEEIVRSTGVRVPILYIDMDGTLVDPALKIRPATLAALERYKACGGRVGFATGRTLDQAMPVITEAKPNMPVVLFNGAVAVAPDASEVLFVNELSEEAYTKALDAFRSLGIAAQGLIVEAQNERVIERGDAHLLSTLKEHGIDEYRVDPAMKLSPGQKPIKMMVFLDQKDIADTAQKLENLLEGQVSVFGAHATVEIVPRGINKAVAIKRLLEGSGFELGNDVYIIGDSGNDVAMLEDAAYGFAMGNCRPSACKAADAIIGSNDTDAIANLINHVAISPDCKVK